MSTDNNEPSPKHYTLKPTFTPLPSWENKTDRESERKKCSNSIIRAANEDDDLYDPYSDVHDGTLKPLHFEKNPWD